MYAIADLKEQNETALAAQHNYSVRNKVPDFSYTRCPRCRKTFIETLMNDVRTFDEALLIANSQLITGCGSCGQTWCD